MSGVGESEAGLVSGLTNTAHEIGIALVLAVLSTIALGGVGAGSLAGATDLNPALATDGFADAFRAAAGIAFGAAVLALTALRASDVARGSEPAFAH
jgi:hypothetical protein